MRCAYPGYGAPWLEAPLPSRERGWGEGALVRPLPSIARHYRVSREPRSLGKRGAPGGFSRRAPGCAALTRATVLLGLKPLSLHGRGVGERVRLQGPCRAWLGLQPWAESANLNGLKARRSPGELPSRPTLGIIRGSLCPEFSGSVAGNTSSGHPRRRNPLIPMTRGG